MRIETHEVVETPKPKESDQSRIESSISTEVPKETKQINLFENQDEPKQT